MPWRRAVAAQAGRPCWRQFGPVPRPGCCRCPLSVRRRTRAAFQNEVFGATRERMLREFCDLMEVLSVDRPLVLVLEDLHWSDFADA